MKVPTLLFFSILSILTSCNGQTYNSKNQTDFLNEIYVKGDTVKELGSSIMVIYQDKKNTYWFGIWNTGVYRFDGKTLINYTTKHGLHNNRVDDIKEDKSGNIYFSGMNPNSTITKFDGKSFSKIIATPSNEWKLEDNDLWLLNAYQAKQKVFRFDGKTFYELTLPKPPKLTNPFEVYCIYRDKKGNIWFGTKPVGVCRYDGKSFEWITEEDVTEFRNEGANGVRSIQEDKNGNIWFETSKGVSSYDGTKITNHTPMIDFDVQHEWKKSENDLWFGGGNNAGVYRYDGLNLNYLAFPSPKVINPDNVYFVTGISEGRNNMHWFAAYAGIYGYDGNQFTIINDETLGLRKETGKLHIRSVLEDSKGRLWIGNNGIGVLMNEKGTTINFSEQHNLIHPTSTRSGDKSEAGTLEHVFSITEDREGNIWFGDRDTGVWKYDGKSMMNYLVDEKLQSQMVLNIYEDQSNNLLFGMAAGGIYQFNGKSFDRRF